MSVDGFLFSDWIGQRQAVFAASEFAALLPGEKVADLFCGAGGWGEGARELGICVDFAVNHDPVAIAAHRANNPGCLHHQGDAWRARPRDVIGARTKLGLLLASAACTTHSRARGSAPISKRVHMLGWCISRWMKEAQPRVVLIENVTEWQDWGPTIVVDGVRRQDPARKGQHFRRWWRYCERLGYVMEMRVLDAPDFGAASRRKRLFIQARRDGQPICWPEVTHGTGSSCRRPLLVGGSIADSIRHRRGAHEDGCGEFKRDNAGSPVSPSQQDRSRGSDAARSVTEPVHHEGRRPYRTAAECIDWSDLGTSIFDRPRPLRPKTLARIVEGIRRFVLNDPAPFVLQVTQTGGEAKGWKVWPVDQPMPTQTTRQDVAVCTPIVAPQNSGVYGQRPDAPGPAITTKGHQSLISPILATTGYGERSGQAARVHQVAELLGTCVDGVKQAVVSPVLMHNTSGHTGGRVDGTLPTVTTGGQTGLVAPVMAYMRHGGGQHSRPDEPLHTPTAGGNHATLVAALMMQYYGNSSTLHRADKPLGAVTTLDRHGLVSVMIDGTEWTIVDILFRMLRPAELAKAMGFRDDYAWPRTQRDTVRLIGNAVCPPVAKALIGAALPGHRPNIRKAVAS